MHEKEYYHGDISMKNIMIKDKNAFLIDYGFS